MYRFAALAFVILFSTTEISAQECGRSYARRDRAFVKQVFVDVSTVVDRLHELAVLSNELNLAPQTQRAAMNAEYQALVQYITMRGDSRPSNTRRRTRRFLARVVDADFLGLSGTLVDGENEPQAVANTYEALRRTFAALRTLWGCI